MNLSNYKLHTIQTSYVAVWAEITHDCAQTEINFIYEPSFNTDKYGTK